MTLPFACIGMSEQALGWLSLGLITLLNFSILEGANEGLVLVTTFVHTELTLKPLLLWSIMFACYFYLRSTRSELVCIYTPLHCTAVQHSDAQTNVACGDVKCKL